MANRDRNTPLSAICPMKTPAPSPPEPGAGVLTHSTTPRKTGAPASTASIARLRGLRKTFRSSERNSRSQCRTGADCRRGLDVVTPVALAVDIEALPGQLDEQVLQAGPHGLEPGHGDARVDKLGVNRLRGVLAEGCANLPVGDGNVGQLELAEHLSRSSGVHAADQGPDLTGPLRVQAVGRLVQDHQVPRPEQAGRDAEPLLHAEGVGAVPLVGGGEQADLIERMVDPRPCGAQVRGGIGGVAPGQILAAGQKRVEGRALDQRADSRQHRVEAVPGVGAKHPERSCRGVHQAEQHPDRSRLARAVRPEEAVDAAVRYRQVDVVDSELSAAETHREPGRRDGQASLGLSGYQWHWLGRSWLGQRHLTFAASAYSTAGVTAPASSSPLLVTSTESRLVRSSRPDPHEPCTGVAAFSITPRNAMACPGPPENGPDRLAPPDGPTPGWAGPAACM